MPKAKYYAVREGRTKGIFTNWDDCKRSVHGYNSAQYKSFMTLDDAQAYFSSERRAPLTSNLPPDGTVLAYVDGSYQHETKRYSFGCVIITPDGGETESNGTGSEPQAAENRNIAGELLGAMFAIRWAKQHNFSSIIIRHDYEGIAKWKTGEWKANSYCALKYLEFLAEYKDIDIRFEKVRAHSGEPFNERVDLLAKQALEVKP